jgi:hypothetical protein
MTRKKRLEMTKEALLAMTKETPLAMTKKTRLGVMESRWLGMKSEPAHSGGFAAPRTPGARQWRSAAGPSSDRGMMARQGASRFAQPAPSEALPIVE